MASNFHIFLTNEKKKENFIQNVSYDIHHNGLQKKVLHNLLFFLRQTVLLYSTKYIKMKLA